MNRLKKVAVFLSILLTLALSCTAASLVYFQEHLLFPYYHETQRKSEAARAEPVSGNAIRILLDPGEEQIEVWHSPVVEPSRGVAIIFRANMGTLSDHASLIDLANARKFDAVIFNYPGMGLSKGSLNQRSLLTAADRVIRRFSDPLHPDSRKLWIFGYSIGTGPAGVLAEKYEPDLLLLFAPYTSIRDVIRSTRYGALAAFSRYDFNLIGPISRLQKSNLIVTTGGADTTILPEMSIRVLKSYQGRGRTVHIHNPTAPHDHLVGANRFELDQMLESIVDNTRIQE